MEIENRVCLVTGGTKGIGAATAVALARRGGRICIVGRHPAEAGKGIPSLIRELGRECHFINADVSKPDEARRSVRETVERFGSVDVLVHSAGGPVPGTFLELNGATWNLAFDTHVHAIFHLCQEAVPVMQKKGEGAIVLISSAAGLRGVAGAVAYQVVKGALPQFTRALAREFARDGIRVNCVAPGVIRTAFHANMTEETKRHNLENRIPLKREGTSEQVADLIVTLVGNDYMTGETVSIDGGLTMRIC